MLPYVMVFGKYMLPLYGVIFMSAFFLAVFIVGKRAPKYGVAKDDVTFSAIYGILGLAVGAKALFFITKLPSIINNWKVAVKLMKLDFFEFMNYAFGGWVFYGGLIGFVVGMYIYCRIYKVDFIMILDMTTPFLPFVHGFGRIACFTAGCCYGVEYHGIGAIHFPYNEFVPELNAFPRFPVQLTEAACNFIMFAILLAIFNKGKLRKGKLLGVYLIYYSVMRFFLEFLRGDLERGKVGGVSTSQLISLLLLPVGIFLIYKGLHKREKIKLAAVSEENP